MRPCLVMGSGRSGTSLVAGCLHGAGYWMGDDLIDGTDGNPKGYFESRTIERLNEELLLPLFPMRPSGLPGMLFRSRLGRSHRWLARVPLDAQIETPRELAARMRSCIRSEPFAYKDPRFCFTLPCWREMLPKSVCYVCVFRRPEQTAASMLREWKREPYLRSLRFTKQWALEVWSLCYRHILDRHAAHGDWLFLHYEQVFTDEGMGRLEAHIDARVDRSFPDRSLSHQRDVAPMDAPLQAVYDALCQRAGFTDAAS